MSHPQQLISDLSQKLRHSFSKDVGDKEVNLNEFKSVFTKVFTGVSNEKLQQIFVSFDEESKGTINWYKFLKQEQLSQILISLHDDCMSQITMLQRSPHITPQLSRTTSMGPLLTSAHSSVSIDVQSVRFTDNVHNTNTTTEEALPFHVNQSIESVATLEQEVMDKNAEISRLREWITEKGIPAQKSISTFEQKEKHLYQRESEIVEEMKQYQDLNESLKAQNAVLHKEHQQLQSQHMALQNEHKSFKALCNEIQMKYDECLDLYKKEKQQIKHLMNVNEDLNKLKDQYERVNNDQNNKIERYKLNIDELREKCNVFEMYIQDIVQENDTLHQWINTNSPSTNSPEDKLKARNRALSAVREDTESTTPTNGLKINTNADDIAPRPLLEASTSFNVQTFDDIARRYSMGGNTGKRSSGILGRMRSRTNINTYTPLTTTGTDNEYPSYHTIADSLNLVDRQSNSSNVSQLSRRKRTISIISLGSFTPFGKKSQLENTSPLVGLSERGISEDSMVDVFDDDDDGSGYADAAYEELGSDFDQLQEITDQIRQEVQEEMEEELEAQIQNKYDLKIMKLNTKHNEQLVLLNVEIDRLKSVNKQQTKKIKILQSGGTLDYVDDQKTNEDYDINIYDSNSVDNESDRTYDDDITPITSSGLDDEYENVSYDKYSRDTSDDTPLISDKRKHDKKKKKKEKKRRKKLQKKWKKENERQMAKGKFCCSTLFGSDYKKIHNVDMDVAKKHKKKKKKKKKNKERKKRKKNREIKKSMV